MLWYNSYISLYIPPSTIRILNDISQQLYTFRGYKKRPKMSFTWKKFWKLNRRNSQFS